jgi:hypothetical protein
MLMTVDTFSHFSPAIKPRFTAALTLWGYSKRSAGKSDHRVDQGTEWDDRHTIEDARALLSHNYLLSPQQSHRDQAETLY